MSRRSYKQTTKEPTESVKMTSTTGLALAGGDCDHGGDRRRGASPRRRPRPTSASTVEPRWGSTRHRTSASST